MAREGILATPGRTMAMGARAAVSTTAAGTVTISIVRSGVDGVGPALIDRSGFRAARDGGTS